MIQTRLPKFDSHMQEVMKGALSAFLIRIFGMLLGFSISVLISRMLGAEGAGIYFLALSMATIAATVGRVGFDNTVVRFIASHASANEWGDVCFVYRIAIKVVSVASLLVALVLFASAGWLASNFFGKPFMELPLRIVAVAVLPLGLAMIQADSLRGLKSIAASQWIQNVFIPLSTLVVLYPLVQLWGANGAVAAYTTAVVFTSIVAWSLWHKAIRSKARSINHAQATISMHTIFQSSWSLFGVALMGLAMQQVGTIFLGTWGTVEDVGIFNVANRMANLLLFPLIAMISILTPKFAAMYRQEDMEGLIRITRSSSKIITAVVIPIAIVVAMGAEWIFALFGSSFKDGALVLDILLIGVVINAATGAVAELLMMAGHENEVRAGVSYSAFISLVLCLLFIPKYGQVGAAIAVASGMGAQNLYMLVKVKMKLGFWPIPLTV